MNIFDNPDFYPTPNEVIISMLSNIDLTDKVVLEPHGGSGDLIDAIIERGAKEVICCEKSENLAKICSDKADRFLKNDFLEVESNEISHIDFIIANPPFSNADEHILHMWDIAPDGCEIVSLCNWETINNQFSRKRLHLQTIVDKNGTKDNLGNCFSNAERKTDVEVGLIHLFKPKAGDNEFDGYFDLGEEYQQQENGIMAHNEVLELVNRYVGAVKYFDEVVDMQERMNQLISPISVYENGIEFKASYRNNNKSYQKIDREVFKKELQKGAWKKVFEKFDMDRFVTKSVMDKINKFVEQQTQVPFTVKNIYKMIEIIAGTHGNTMKNVIIEVFDWLTAHHKENRYQNEGWKTNSEYIVNKKFIAPYCGLSIGYSGFPEIKWTSGGNRMDDLNKALCWLVGKPYDKDNTIEQFFGSCGEPVDFEEITPEQEREDGFSYLEYKRSWEDRDYKKHTTHKVYKFKEEDNYCYKLTSRYDAKVARYKLFGKWYDWGFFKVKVYKKGTMHCIFNDEKVWELFNRESAKAKGFTLASKFTSDMREKTNGVEIYQD